jgi:TolB-like protein
MILALLAAVAATRLPARPPYAPDSRPAAPAKLRVAAPPLAVLGDPQPELRKFVGGLQAEMVDRLNRSQVDVASPDQAGAVGGEPGVAYAFGGAVERDGRDLVVHLHLDDARQHVTVWSDLFRQPAEHADTLRGAAASEAAVVASVAVEADRIANGDAEIVALIIKANRYARRDVQADREDEWENQKLLLAKLPRLARSHANLAVISAFLATTSPARAAELKAMAQAEADAALKIDPHNDLAYLAKTLSYPLVGYWRERETGLLAGLKVAPGSEGLTDHESNFLRQVGRLRDAVTWGRLAAAPRPAADIGDATLLLALGVDEQTGEAAAFADTLAQAWPAHSAVWNARLQVMIYQSRWREAAELFAPGAYRPYEITEAEAQAWRDALRAMDSGNAEARLRAARALAAVQTPPNFITQAPYEAYAPGERIGMLAILGAKDEAFRQAAAYLKPDAYADSAFLFWPNLAGFRRDPRFAKLVTDMGLVAYWKTANAWPDFCGDPDLPYKCKALPAR